MRSRLRLTMVLAVLALVAAACGGGTGETTASTTGDTTGSTAASSSTTSSTTTTTTTTTTEAPAPAEVDLELTDVTPETPDPLETIMPLEGVTVSMNAGGAYVFTFAAVMYGGASMQLTGLPDGEFVSCSWYGEADFAGDGEGSGCFSQTSGGFSTDEPYSNGDAPANSIVVMIEVTMDSISVTVGDTTYTGTGLRFDDGPLFVQIDPNTGGLSEPVTRRSGDITAAELYAALNG